MDIQNALTTLDHAVIIVYVVSLLTLGFWVSFRKQHTSDLFLAGRTLGWPNIGLSIFGTNVSPSMMIASCGLAYSAGMVGGNFEWLAWMFLLLLAMVFVPHYLHSKVSTMPEFMSRRFGKGCHDFLAWYTLFGTVLLWLGGTLYAGGTLMGQIMGWPLWLSVLFLAVVATSFTVAGGLAAVVYTDSFQSLLMIAASVWLTIVGVTQAGGITGMADSLPPDYWALFRPASDSKYPWHAIILGYPVIGIWFWCTDQTIVQRVLGGRDLRQGQLGAVFAGYLKILTPLIFFVPGIACKVLHPNLADQDTAYMTMVTTYLPNGMIGLIVAVLIAALISTVDSGLNSFSTIFTLDIYCNLFRAEASTRERILVGRLTTVAAAIIAIGWALTMQRFEKSLFDLLQGIISFLAPPMTAVFLVGIVWKRATPTAALLTLIFGVIISMTTGYLLLSDIPNKEFWPHYMLVSFCLCVGLIVFMILVSLITDGSRAPRSLPTLAETYAAEHYSTRPIWRLWAVLGVIMIGIYLFFELYASR